MKEKIKLDYDEISPVTGNKCVLVEADQKTNTDSYLCMESGFTTHEKLIEGSDFQEKYETRLTDLMLSCKIIDDTNKAWYPTFMQVPGGMLYAEGKSQQSWRWKVAQIIPILGEDRKNYPVVGKEGEYHTSRLDVDNAKTYNNDDFGSALEELYTILRGQYNEQQ